MYESHITVQGIDYEDFAAICSRLGLKPIHIQMDTAAGIDQMMSSRFHKTTKDQALTELHGFADAFPGVIRRKLEMVIGKNTPIPPDFLYREFHSKFLMREEALSTFLDFAVKSGVHTSRNASKPAPGPGMVYHFASTREEAPMTQFLRSLPEEYKFVNSIAECVIFDDNPSMDTNWNCFECPLKQRINL